jgi:hypothetical protein
VVDRVLWLVLVATDPRSDSLSGSVSHNIAARCSEGCPLVPAKDPRPGEDLYDGLELHLPWTQDFLDPVSRGSGDAQVYQQSMKPASGDRSFSPKGLHLIGISVHLLNLCLTQGGSTPHCHCLHCSHHDPPAAAPQRVCPGLLSTQVPPARPEKTPPPEICVVVCRAMALLAVAHFEVSADQRAINQCSCVRCGEYEPSIIYKEKSVR